MTAKERIDYYVNQLNECYNGFFNYLIKKANAVCTITGDDRKAQFTCVIETFEGLPAHGTPLYSLTLDVTVENDVETEAAWTINFINIPSLELDKRLPWFSEPAELLSVPTETTDTVSGYPRTTLRTPAYEDSKSNGSSTELMPWTRYFNIAYLKTPLDIVCAIPSDISKYKDRNPEVSPLVSPHWNNGEPVDSDKERMLRDRPAPRPPYTEVIFNLNGARNWEIEEVQPNSRRAKGIKRLYLMSLVKDYNNVKKDPRGNAEISLFTCLKEEFSKENIFGELHLPAGNLTFPTWGYVPVDSLRAYFEEPSMATRTAAVLYCIVTRHHKEYFFEWANKAFNFKEGFDLCCYRGGRTDLALAFIRNSYTQQVEGYLAVYADKGNVDTQFNLEVKIGNRSLHMDMRCRDVILGVTEFIGN